MKSLAAVLGALGLASSLGLDLGGGGSVLYRINGAV
jgi:hypothetical protein